MVSGCSKDAREAEREQFLSQNGWRPESASLLAADASFRCYFRLRQGEQRAVLMDAPPPLEDVRPFLAIARHLVSLDLSAPQLYAADSNRGFVLLEDFGDDTYTRLLQRGADATDLYSLAVDTLIQLHVSVKVTAIDVPIYDVDRLLQETTLLTDWFMPAHKGIATTDVARQEYLHIWRTLLLTMATPTPTLVLRDYHVDNLMRLPGRTGVAACGLLDFQDAVIGSPAYDLVSLLEDARLDVDPELQELILARYLQALPDADGSFARDYRLLGVQRHCKVAGIFVRLLVRDRKPAYLRHLGRVMRMLERGLQAADLAPLRAWFDYYLPDRLLPLPNPEPEQLLPISGEPSAHDHGIPVGS